MKHHLPSVRVALLGCGQIADAHLSQLRRIHRAEVVAVCDVHADLADQAAARFDVPLAETCLERMLERARPDVVHVTTPAHTHARLAADLLDSGCHVYVEKPFTLNADEAVQLAAVAQGTGKQVCVGHDQLFDPCWLRCRQWIEQGVIGEVRHVESLLGYPIAGAFGKLVAADSHHWVHQLPGGLFQNTISHPLYRIADLMPDTQPAISGNWHHRPEFNFPTELSISLWGEKQTGALTFSTLLPPQRVTRVYGTQGTIDIDFDAQTLRLHRQMRMPGAFAKLEAPLQHFHNACGNLSRNLWRFARSDIHYFAGMKNLFERFYACIKDDAAPPIPIDDAVRVTRLMDRIFSHCRERESAMSKALHHNGAEQLDRETDTTSRLPNAEHASEEVTSCR